MALYESWLFPVLETAHLVGLMMLVGAIALENWSIWTAGTFARERLFWWGALAQAATGPLLFLANMPRYTANSAFAVKMVLLVLAMALEWAKPRWPRRALAAGSLALWTAVIVAARLIADFDAP